ncbi:MAG: SDR family oxidoreductase [Methanothrix sp.]|jgi:NAD(P)-dependent dehydrogenase (short-subunit alcohol dehydrogenase family)|uniref:Short-chain dehydrogenase/reductase n=1 Tax=Methanothrix harundinacea TaxID=301375 RepID=A0A101IGA7_9EURY|nr:MAG: Short-chain dehydrogenase/reductase [Methanothrix harundinacea]KUK94468.1 MAG: Short-chain dehydrogenase/reductase [Methanothrix harundinacea]MCP1392662.1 SDR family oxidoreductase [Methanothrix harundinacea]MDD3709900.1 SDR family oxidoreductase [Methanothrix sp.]MDD5767250.1 SDR family oxidoreductase [Methanothrix sp.]
MSETKKYYENKVAVVTGGASGIGLALCEAMLAFGAKKVVLADINKEKLEGEAARLDGEYPGNVLGLICDVTNEENVKDMIAKSAAFGEGRIDVLFNNAGVGLSGLFEEQTTKDWEKAFAINFYSAVYGIRAAIPIMKAQGGGHIIDVISGIAFSPMAQQTMYSATKAALNGLTLALRYEYWDENICFTSATPGTTITAIWGENKPPEGAQTAEQSASRILEGVARRERLVLGDDGDVSGATNCFNPLTAEGVDAYLLDVARKRRSGEWVV